MMLYRSFLFVALSLLPLISADENPFLDESALDLFRTELDSVVANGKYVHVVEFGGGYETGELSTHDAVISWSVVTHNEAAAASLSIEYAGSNRVTVKYVPGDFDIWGGKLLNPWDEEGSMADFESYVSEILYFGAKDRAAYWVFNNGKAKVDIGIAALPLLVRTGGKMVVSGWNSNECYSQSLKQFYNVDEISHSVAILSPKNVEYFLDLMQKDKYSHYDWCFSFVRGGKGIVQLGGPSDTGGVVHAMQRDEIGCADIGGSAFCCSKDRTSCASCYGVMTAVSNRGHRVKQSLKRISELRILNVEL